MLPSSEQTQAKGSIGSDPRLLFPLVTGAARPQATTVVVCAKKPILVPRLRKREQDCLYFKMGLCRISRFSTVKCTELRVLTVLWATLLFHPEVLSEAQGPLAAPASSLAHCSLPHTEPHSLSPK